MCSAGSAKNSTKIPQFPRFLHSSAKIYTCSAKNLHILGPCQVETYQFYNMEPHVI